MNNNLKYLFILVCFFFASYINAQCPSGDIILSTQTEVIAFQRVYPDCDHIYGALKITGSVYDLSPLANIVSIDSLLSIENCDLLETTSTLKKLQNVFSAKVEFATKLKDLSLLKNIKTLNDLSLSDLPEMKNLDDLDNLVKVHNDLTLTNITSNYSFKSNILSIGGSFKIENWTNIENLSYFSKLKSCKKFYLYNCPALIDIGDFNCDEKLLKVFDIRFNKKLNNCSTDNICKFLTLDSTSIILLENGIDCSSRESLKSICTGIPLSCPVDEVVLIGQKAVNKFREDFPTCKKVNSIRISSTPSDEIQSLKPLSNIEEVELYLTLHNANELDNLEGFNNIKKVGVSILFIGNPKIKNLNELSQVQYFKYLHLGDNNSLSDISGLHFENISSDGSISIFENKSLFDLTPLSKIDSLGELSILNNSAIKSLNGLSGLKHIDLLYTSGVYGIDSLPILSNPLVVDKFYLNQWAALKNVNFDPNFIIKKQLSISSSNIESIVFNNQIPSIDELDIHGIDNLKTIEFKSPYKSIGKLTCGGINKLVKFIFPKELQEINELEFHNNHELKSIEGGNLLNKINTISIIGNKELIDVSGLDHDIEAQEIRIQNNEKLSNCAIAPLCLLQDKNHLFINNNSGPCNFKPSALKHCNQTIKNPFEDIRITNLSDLNTFKNNYPNADTIYGGLTFSNCSDINQSDLEYFRQIKSAGQGIYFSECNFTSLESFANIKTFRIKIESLNKLKSLPLFSKQRDGFSFYLSGGEMLASLKGLDSISTAFDISFYNVPLVTNLDGLQNLKEVKYLNLSYMKIRDMDSLRSIKKVVALNINHCSFIHDLGGLSKISSAKFVDITFNELLESLFINLENDTLGRASIYDNPSLLSIDGFDKVAVITGDLHIQICKKIEKIDKFNNLVKVGGQLWIINCNNLISISFPKLSEVYNLKFLSNYSTTSFGSYPNLKVVNQLTINDNKELIDLGQVNDALLCKFIEVSRNPKLSFCNVGYVCNNIKHGTKVNFVENNTLCETESIIENLCGFTAKKCPSYGYTIYDDHSSQVYNKYYSECPVIDDFLTLESRFTNKPNFTNLKAIYGPLKIETFAIKTITFDSLQRLNGEMSICYTKALKSIAFPELRYANTIGIKNNYSLVDINKFDNLITSYEIRIERNDSLKTINGFGKLESVQGIGIFYNQNLDTIGGFKTLSSVNFLSIYDNEQLINVSGFDHDFTMQSLYVSSNDALDECSVIGFCNHIQKSRYSNISGNASNCVSEQAILARCTVSSNDVAKGETIKVHPNPTSQFLYIDTDDAILDVIIYDVMGKSTLIKPNENIIDMIQFNSGFYVLKIRTKNGVKTAKVFLEK